MRTATISQSFYLSLVQFLLHAKQEVVGVSHELGLSAMQAFTLLLTDNDKPRSMNTFCRLYDCDASNITGIVDGLEQKGLVSRREHPTDRRIKVIRLEPAGEAMKLELIRRLTHANRSLFETLDSSETKQLESIIKKLAGGSVVGAVGVEPTTKRL